MNARVYKTEKGRNLIESYYRNILRNYSLYPYEQLNIKSDIGNTHVLRFGNKHNTPLVLLHGTASNSAMWLGVISIFINDFCIYCIDIPGEPGLSEPVRIKLASEMPYNWLSSLLNNLSIPKASFITASLGSWYILNFAIRNPNKVGALSMITTSGIVAAKKSFIFKAIFFMLLGKAGQKMLSISIYHKIKVPEEVLDFQALVSRHFIPVMEVIPIFNDAQLRNISFPIQFFGGDKDQLINSVNTGERLKNILPHTDIHILKDTGHVIIDQFDTIKKFLIANSK